MKLHCFNFSNKYYSFRICDLLYNKIGGKKEMREIGYEIGKRTIPEKATFATHIADKNINYYKFHHVRIF